MADSDCEKPMRLRWMTPSPESIAPVDVNIWFGSIGSGNAEHFTLHLYLNDEEIPGRSESDCYKHEGPLDFHCNLMFSPNEPLLPNTTYRYRALATEEHMNPAMFVDAAFTTNGEVSSIESTASSLVFTGYQSRGITNPNSCKWPDSFQHNFVINLPHAQPYDSIIHVYELMPDGSSLLVHSLFLPTGDLVIDFRQVVVPGEEGEHCYYVQQEDLAGNKADPSNIACFDPFNPEPSSEPEETGIAQEDEPDIVAETQNWQMTQDGSCQHIHIRIIWAFLGLFYLVFRQKNREQSDCDNS